jgi:hypothetical protein
LFIKIRRPNVKFSVKEKRRFTDEILGHGTVSAGRASVERGSVSGDWRVHVDPTVAGSREKARVIGVHIPFSGGDGLGGRIHEFLSAFGRALFAGLGRRGCSEYGRSRIMHYVALLMAKRPSS